MDHNQSPSSLRLLGSWASSYTHRVQLALKLKGIEFEYIEEDLANKSPSLIQHNPIYKKVPVLIHGHRSIVESIIILQYIDETWPDKPVMPTEPFDRAIARFWCHFADDKLGPAVGAVFASFGDAQQSSVSQVHENLKLIEQEMREGAFKGKRFFGGDEIGVLDIVFGCGSYWLAVFEQVMQVKIVDPQEVPLFHAWLQDFENHPAVQDIIPSVDKLMEYAKEMRRMILSINNGDNVVAIANTVTTPAPTPTATNVTANSGDIVVDS